MKYLKSYENIELKIGDYILVDKIYSPYNTLPYALIKVTDKNNYIL